jgi:tetratricopeptide (TPR) repeat protein
MALMRGALAGVLVVLTLAAGCAPKLKESERYKPAETLLEILADFQRHINDDTYRFPTFKDITGQNIYKATLIRLNNFEKLHPNKFGPIVAYTRARAYEKLHDFEAAISSYQQLMGTGSELEPKAKEGIRRCRAFLAAMELPSTDGSIGQALEAYEQRRRALERLIEEYRGSPAEYTALELQEKADVDKVSFIEANRSRMEAGTELAIVEYNRLIKRHEESKNVYRHILGLGRLFEKLAHEYASRHDPESLGFNMDEFMSYAESALGLYNMVASKDGIMERAEAEGLAKSLRAYVRKVRSLHR